MYMERLDRCTCMLSSTWTGVLQGCSNWILAWFYWLQLLEPESSINTHYNYQGYLQIMITITEKWQVRNYNVTLQVEVVMNYSFRCKCDTAYTQGSQSTTNWSQFVISQTFLIVCYSCMSQSLGSQVLPISIYTCIYSLLHPCFYSNRWVIYTCIHHSQVFTHRKWLVAIDYSLCSLQNSGNFNQILKQGSDCIFFLLEILLPLKNCKPWTCESSANSLDH